MKFLSTYPSASSIAFEDIRNLREALKTEGRGRKCKVTTEEIRELTNYWIDRNLSLELIHKDIQFYESRLYGMS